jgi:hypothetical protein
MFAREGEGGGQAEAEAASKKPQSFFAKNVVGLMLQPLTLRKGKDLAQIFDLKTSLPSPIEHVTNVKMMRPNACLGLISCCHNGINSGAGLGPVPRPGLSSLEGLRPRCVPTVPRYAVRVRGIWYRIAVTLGTRYTARFPNVLCSAYSVASEGGVDR